MRSAEFFELSEELVRQGRLLRFTVYGASMRPLLRAGDIVTVEPVDPSLIGSGDVLYFKAPSGKYFLHRLICRSRQGLLFCKGDACGDLDPLIDPRDVLGRLVLVQRGVRFFRVDTMPHRLLNPLRAFSSRYFSGFFSLAFFCLRVFRRVIRAFSFYCLKLSFLRRVLSRRLASSVLFERAVVSDAFSLVQLYEQEAKGDFRAQVVSLEKELALPEEYGQVLVARQKEKILGALSLIREAQEEDSWLMSSLFVRWDFRGRGIGRRLVESACSFVSRQGGAKIRILVFEDRRLLLRWYASLGFRRSPAPDPAVLKEEIPNIPGARRAGRRIVFEKSISPPGEDASRLFFFSDVSCEVFQKREMPWQRDRLLLLLSRRDARGRDLCCLAGECLFDEDLLSRALRERLAPLIYRNFESVAPGIIPTGVLDQMRSAYYVTAARNLLILKETESLAQDCRSEKIPLLFFKGIVLATEIYGDSGLRSMTDVDCLVHGSDFFRLDALLRGRGYKPSFRVNRLEQIKSNPFRNSILYSRPGPEPRFFHVYWHLLNLLLYSRKIPDSFDMERIWEHSVKQSAGGLALKTLRPEHQLIYLSLHAFVHAYRPLILIADIVRFAEFYSTRFDWEFFIRESIDFGLSKYVYHSLRLVSEAVDCVFPPEVMQQLRPKRISRFEKDFLSGVKQGKGCRGLGWANFGMNENLSGRGAYVAAALFPSKEEMAFVKGKSSSDVGVLDYLRWLVGGVQ